MPKTVYTIGILLCLLCIQLTGCIAHFPKYPSAWSPLHTGSGNCVDVTGTYENLGQSEREHGMITVHLASVLLPATKEKETVSTVRLQPSGASIEAVAALSDGTTRSYTLSDNGKCTATERYLKDPNSPGGVSKEGIVGIIHTSLILYRAEDGSLIIKSIEKDAVVAMIIPVATNYQYWFRFAAKATTPHE